MTDDASNLGRFSLRRWSQRKLEAARAAEAPRGGGTPGADADQPRRARVENPISAPAEGVLSSDATAGRAAEAPVAASPATGGPAGVQDAAVELPPVASLTVDSDFLPFMQPGVDEDIKRRALRQLFRDPAFNVMDGLDVYIDDYSIPSPIDAALVRTLVQARHIFNPPKTRVNADGHVEDVPDEPQRSAPMSTDPDAAGSHASDAIAAGGIAAAGAENSAPGAVDAGDFGTADGPARPDAGAKT